jgi:hypothetical protein
MHSSIVGELETEVDGLRTLELQQQEQMHDRSKTVRQANAGLQERRDATESGLRSELSRARLALQLAGPGFAPHDAAEQHERDSAEIAELRRTLAETQRSYDKAREEIGEYEQEA